MKTQFTVPIISGQGATLNVGHIYLEGFCNGTGAQVICLIEALGRLGLRQHALVSGRSLARRLSNCKGVTVGPLVNSPVMGFCLMPKVDLVHVHDEACGRAGLLLTLTRGLPFVITMRGGARQSHNPLSHSVYRRAAGLICNSAETAGAMSNDVPGDRIHVIPDIVLGEEIDRQNISDSLAAEHLPIYQHIVDCARKVAMSG